MIKINKDDNTMFLKNIIEKYNYLKLFIYLPIFFIVSCSENACQIIQDNSLCLSVHVSNKFQQEKGNKYHPASFYSYGKPRNFYQKNNCVTHDKQTQNHKKTNSSTSIYSGGKNA